LLGDSIFAGKTRAIYYNINLYILYGCSWQKLAIKIVIQVQILDHMTTNGKYRSILDTHAM